MWAWQHTYPANRRLRFHSLLLEQKEIKDKNRKQNTDCLFCWPSELKGRERMSRVQMKLRWFLEFDLLVSKNCRQQLSTSTLRADRNQEKLHLSILPPHAPVFPHHDFTSPNSLYSLPLKSGWTPSALTSISVRWLTETECGSHLNSRVRDCLGRDSNGVWMAAGISTSPRGSYNHFHTENYFYSNIPPTSSFFGNCQNLFSLLTRSQQSNVLKKLLVVSVLSAGHIFKKHCYK